MSALAASFLVAISGFSATKEAPKWNHDYGVALQQTKNSHKPLLVLIDKPADPQKGSTEVVLQADDTLREILIDYTLCYVDANSDYGRSVAEVFGVERYPFAAVIDGDGRKVMEKWTGTRTATQWLDALGGPEEPQELIYRGQNSEEPEFSSVYRRGRTSRTCYT